MGESGTYAAREPVTMRTHDRPWAADLETQVHATDRELVVVEALEAIEQTRPGQFVDLVTHEQHGHPSTYLYDRLVALSVNCELSDQGRCPCGGYVTRVSVGESP